MGSHKKTSEIIDKILLVGISGSTIAVSLTLPGSVIVFGPILEKYLSGYDKRQKEREYQKVIAYMKRQNLLKLEPKAGNGLVLTRKGAERAKKAAINTLEIDISKTWDSKWRIVLFDIPESYKRQRDLLTSNLKRLGFYQLQRSVWVHPYPIKEEIAAISLEYKIEQYITLIEAAEVENSPALKKHFKKIIS